jgi:hypothetical protein
MWSCTESLHFESVGACKADAAQCEAFRTSMIDRYHDLTLCHDLATASCFDVGNDAHCAPSAELCDTLRAAATKRGATASACARRKAK